MENELARLNTMAALGEMAATIAHQVRNPLAGIGGFAGLLSRDIPKDDPRHRTVQKIIRGVDSLNNTVTTLLNYTRSEEMNRQTTDFSVFLNESIKQFQHDSCDLEGASNISLEVTPPAGGGTISLYMDDMLVRQVIFNLLTDKCSGSM